MVISPIRLRVMVAAIALLGLTHQPAASAQSPAPAAERTRVSLDGAWRFALDPTRTGEPDGWFAPALDESRWDRVDVPHCWPIDPRYAYTGTAWYRRTFDAPADLQGRHARLEFDAVFARARVWVNGQLVGSHEGGYTPFGFDVTPHLIAGRPNKIAVAVDNSWSLTTIPGARPGSDPTRRVYPWWDYGGIVRPVTLVLSAPIFITNQRVVATPDLASGRATIESTIWVRNTTSSSSSVRVNLALARINSEGVRESQRQSERETWFREAIGQLRTRPFVAGASVWTFNDYRSRFPDTNANGYRPWGLIDPDRQPRGAYHVVKEEFATLRLTSASLTPGSLVAGAARITARVDLEARADFPSRAIAGMTLRLRRASADAAAKGADRSMGGGRMGAAAATGNGVAPAPAAAAADEFAGAVLASTRVPDLSPGQRITLALDAPAASAPSAPAFTPGEARPRYVVDVVRPDGSIMCSLAVEATSTSWEISQ